MINSIPYYPYQQNVQILKGFFSKPLTLICAIFSGLTCIFGMFSINTSTGSTNISFSSGTGGSISILLCIALILLYAKCRSNDPMPFGATVTLIKIYSIIEIVIGGLALLAFTGITFLIALVLQGQKVFGYILILCIFAIPLALVTLIHGIGLLLWSDSIKKGATSVYLKSRGSILLAVSSILSIIVSVASAIASFIFIKEYGPEISAYLHHLAEENPNFNFSGLFDSSDPMNSLFISAAGIVTVLNTVLSAVFYALLAALAISFHTYIKKYTNGINLGSGQSPEYDAQHNAVAVPPVAPVTSKMPTKGIQPPVQQPIDFQPKSVDFGSMDATSDNKQINTQFENPYMQAVADDMSDKSKTVVCPNCHAQCNNDMKFCGNCGTKLK